MAVLTRRMAVVRMAAVAALSWLPAGCGDALVSAGFQGEPLFELEGVVVDYGFGPTDAEVPTAALFWSQTGDTTDRPEQLVAHSVGVSVTFPATFHINVFTEPDPGAAPYLIGQILVYHDDNGDGRYSPGELRGGAFDSVLFYAPAPVLAIDSPTGLELPAGFSLAQLPLPCGVRPESPEGDNCGVALGASCTGDAQCGPGGVCMENDGYFDYPDGYCVLPETSPCTPANGVLLDVYNEFGAIEFVWVLGCDSGADCRADGYECAAWNAACMPRLPMAIIMAPEFAYLPLCADGGPGGPWP